MENSDNYCKRNRLTKRALLLALLSNLILLTTPVNLAAQDLTSSPYSRYGIGDLWNHGTGRNLGMGGLGIGLQSKYHLNLINPASLSAIDTINLLFEVGGFEKMSQFRTTDLQKTVNNIGFSYLAFGFPVAKWWKASLGIVPYSGVGYSITDTEENPVIGTIQSTFTGKGGLSRFFLSQSISPVKYLSLGASFSYLFGPMSYTKSLIFPSDSMYFSTRSEQKAIAGDIHFDFGAQANIPLPRDFFIILGGTYQHETSLHAESRQLVTSIGQTVQDTLLYNVNPENSLDIPSAWGAGFTFGKLNKFTAGVDYRTADWSKTLFLGQSDSLANSREWIVGLEYIPNAFSLTRYLERVRYRAGFRYNESFLQLRGSQIQEFGINFGAGFPIRDRNRRGTQSSLNLILELGTRGTVKNDLIRENYGMLTVQFTLHDYWFEKRKYD